MRSPQTAWYRSVAFILTLTIFIQSFSVLTLKYATMTTGLLAVFFVGLSFSCLVSRAVLWQGLLARTELSLIYPYTSLAQVLILVYSALLFQEPLSIGHLAGLALMLAGAWTMAER